MCPSFPFCVDGRMWDVIVLIPALGFFYLFYYALTRTAVWLLPMYFDSYIGSSYMIQVGFCFIICLCGRKV